MNEVIAFLDADNTNISADLYIPPPCSVFSDCNSGDEDEPESLNHPSGKQLNVSTEVVTHALLQISSSDDYMNDDRSRPMASRAVKKEK